MELGHRLERARGHLASLTYSQRFFLGCLCVLFLISLGDAAILAYRYGPRHKVRPNSILSPWDVSKAPPQCILRNTVRVVKLKKPSSPPPEQALGWPKRAKRQAYRRAPVQRAAAFAPFAGSNTD